MDLSPSEQLYYAVHATYLQLEKSLDFLVTTPTMAALNVNIGSLVLVTLRRTTTLILNGKIGN